MNAPDPTDTGYFSSVQEVAQLYRIDSATLATQFGLQSGDLVTVSGLVEIADRLRGRRTGSLSSRAVLRASVAASIQNAVRGYNSAIASVGSSNSLRVFDLYAFTKEVRATGVQAGSFRLKGGYRQGFYSQDGLFPSPTGHAVLANRLLQFLNSSYGTNYSPVDVDAVAKRDDLVPKPEDGVSPPASAKQRRESAAIP
jgi:hypothetical protein